MWHIAGHREGHFFVAVPLQRRLRYAPIKFILNDGRSSFSGGKKTWAQTQVFLFLFTHGIPLFQPRPSIFTTKRLCHAVNIYTMRASAHE